MKIEEQIKHEIKQAREIARQDLIKRSFADDVSLCRKCYSITKTSKGKCGKCGGNK